MIFQDFKDFHLYFFKWNNYIHFAYANNIYISFILNEKVLMQLKKKIII